MCMQDIRIGRKSKYRQFVIVTDANALGAIPGRAGRIRLLIGLGTGGAWRVSNDQNTVGTTGFQLPFRTVGADVMRVEDYGPWLEGDLFISGPLAGLSVPVLEVWLDDPEP